MCLASSNSAPKYPFLPRYTGCNRGGNGFLHVMVPQTIEFSIGIFLYFRGSYLRLQTFLRLLTARKMDVAFGKSPDMIYTEKPCGQVKLLCSP